MMRIIARGVISLCPKLLNECVLGPALKRKSTLFDALNNLVALNKSLLRLADRLVGILHARIKDSRDLPFLCAASELELNTFAADRR